MAIVSMPVAVAPPVRERARSKELELGEERRREQRFPLPKSFATAAIMGEEDRQQPCRILDASRSGMRIALKTPLPVGIQIHVRWDNKFYVGASRYMVQRGQDHVIGLELVACSCTGVPGPRLFGWQYLASLADRLLLLRQRFAGSRARAPRAKK